MNITLSEVIELANNNEIASVEHINDELIVYRQIQNEICVDFTEVLNFIKANSSLFMVEVIEETKEISITFGGEQIFGFDSDFIEM